jgi:hypothetical protein
MSAATSACMPQTSLSVACVLLKGQDGQCVIQDSQRCHKHKVTPECSDAVDSRYMYSK